MNHGIAGWRESEVAAFCRALRRGWNISTAFQELFDKLVSNLEMGKGALSLQEAAKILGKEHSPNQDKDVPKAFWAIRKQLAPQAERDFPDLKIEIPEGRYALSVEGPCPSRFKTELNKVIGLLIANAADWFTGRTVRAVVETCRSHSYDLLVDTSDDNRELQESRFERMVGKVEGTLVIPVEDVVSARTIELLRYKPVVLLDRYVQNAPDIFAVHHNDWLGGCIAADYLRSLGCTRVLIVKQRSSIAMEQQLTPLKDREQGCREQLHHSGIEILPLPPEGEGEQGGFLALKKFNESDRGPLRTGDGIFATTDRLALGCRAFVRGQGLEELVARVVGFEGQSFGDYLQPPLPSVFADPEALGRVAAELLFNEMAGVRTETPIPRHYLVEPKLLIPAENGEPRTRVESNHTNKFGGYGFHVSTGGSASTDHSKR